MKEWHSPKTGKERSETRVKSWNQGVRPKPACWLWFACLLIALALPVRAQDPAFNPNFPADTNASLGATITFLVYATSTNPPITYQWQHEGTNLPGATSSLLTLANLEVTNAGAYLAVAWNANGGSNTSGAADLTVDTRFRKITTGPVVTDRGGWQPPNWWDYDKDGYLDLFIPKSESTTAQSALYHNNGDGTFTRTTTNAVSLRALASVNAAIGDYDNDGYDDLFMGHYSSAEDIFRNGGGERFTRLTAAQAGPPVSDVDNSVDVALGDYDRDGFIDLFTPNAWYSLNPALNDALYHNEGDDRPFSKMMVNQVGQLVADNAKTGPCAWVDYDNDGWPDLWVGSGFSEWPPSGRHYLWHNDGNGTFSRVTEQLGSLVNSVAWAVGHWADYDNDGFLDLFLPGWDRTNSLHHNLGGQTFADVSSQANVAEAHMAAQAAWGDYDNDGYLDLIVLGYMATNRCFLYHNNGNGTFTSVGAGSPLHDGDLRIGVAWADYDNDGFLDLLITCGDGTLRQNLLYHNNGNSNTWLKFKLVGKASNRSAIGAKVRVHASVGGQMLWQTREVSGNSGTSGGAGGLIAHFGLRDATNVDLVRIEWPSGIIQTLTNIASGQMITVEEHQEQVMFPPSLSASRAGEGMIQLSATGPTNLLYVFEASTNLVQWTKIAVRTNLTGRLEFTPPTSSGSRQFYRMQVP